MNLLSCFLFLPSENGDYERIPEAMKYVLGTCMFRVELSVYIHAVPVELVLTKAAVSESPAH